MIIRYPTALYRAVLPTEASGGNVTFLISTTDPPRAVAGATKLPESVEHRQRSITTLPFSLQKHLYGQFTFSSFKSNSQTVGTSKLPYEAGQLLDFPAEEVDDSALTDLLGSTETEIRHDTNLLDLEDLGISSDDADFIETVAADSMSSLMAAANIARQQRQDTEVALSENKKSQTEARKALNAVTVLASADPTLWQIQKTLEDKLAELLATETTLTQQANDALTLLTTLLDRIRTVSQLVR